MRVLVVDNYDSFVYNLVHYLAQLGAECVVQRNDEVDFAELTTVDGVLVSPGPSTPERAGQSMAVVQHCAEHKVPLLGVCLGHQAIGAVWQAKVERAPELLHGKTSTIWHNNAGVLAEVKNPFTATRYHSLAVNSSTLPSDFEVTAWTSSGIVMAMRHRELPIEGVQFHPESILTEGGHRMLANWLTNAGQAVSPELVDSLELGISSLQKTVLVN